MLVLNGLLDRSLLYTSLTVPQHTVDAINPALPIIRNIP